ncbi:MAG: Hcp family type VI secretion system effector [Alcanivorax sediminis]|uniref:Hcp family type VI secretion system effector n=1 Tax=Alcanivorax sediminis TaxID=2663008 RepID=UPI003C6AF669
MKFKFLYFLLIIFPLTAFSSNTMYLDIPGIEGESQRAGHEDEIDILSWSWGASVDDHGNACIQDVAFTKNIDKSSADIIMAPITGQVFDTVTLSVRRDSGDAHLDYLVIAFKDVQVTSVSTGGSQGNLLVDSFTLRFATATYTYTRIGDDHSAGEQTTAEIIPSSKCD